MAAVDVEEAEAEDAPVGCSHSEVLNRSINQCGSPSRHRRGRSHPRVQPPVTLKVPLYSGGGGLRRRLRFLWQHGEGRLGIVGDHLHDVEPPAVVFHSYG